jgi:hypothetical protein
MMAVAGDGRDAEGAYVPIISGSVKYRYPTNDKSSRDKSLSLKSKESTQDNTNK